MAARTAKGGEGRLRRQYEAYPYPARDPKDEARRLITGSPSQLTELDHYIFAGRRPADRPFRVLVAGGGTGDATVMLAQQLGDAGGPTEIVHVDLSEASLAIAEARVKARRLSNVTFRRLSLLDLPGSGLGPFDYIDCCGVLHHLDDPAAGLAALAAVLAERGGLGLMVYGALGRTGVYPAQAMLRALGDDDEAEPAARVAVARRLLAQLPPTNWLKRNPFIADHLKGGDAGLYDLLLHSRDRAYTVPEVAALADGAGLRITAFVEPALYDPASYLTDPQILARLGRLSWLDRCAFAENLAGTLRKHVFYAVRADHPGPCVTDATDDTLAPVWRDAADAALGQSLRPGAALTANRDGVAFRFPLPPLAGAILTRVDGHRSIAAIRADVMAANPSLSEAAFTAQFAQTFAAVNGIGKLFLRQPPTG
jgi:SAM-dependent methyltransferase